MFGIGTGEFLALGVVALLVLGPDKLPGFAADAARFLRQMRRMATDARADVRRELGPELADIDLADLNPRNLVRKHVLDPIDELEITRDLDPDDRSNGHQIEGRRSPATGAANNDAKTSESAGGKAEQTAPPYDADAT